MSQGVEQIAALGAKTARVSLSAKYYTDYNIGTSCYPQFSLTAAAQQADVKRALDNPRIETFIITAYDGVTFGDCWHHRYLNPDFYTPEHTAAIVQEYSDFTFYLAQTYQHTRKSFILSNWESDNDVYCGQAWGYATFESVRAECNASYRIIYEGNTSPDDSLRGLRLWLQARERGIAEGRERAAAQGIGGMRVYLAVEFCIIHALRDAGFKSVLYDVLPFVVYDYASYSAYESIGKPDAGNQLKADLDLVGDLVGYHAVILGEVGFSRGQWGSDAVISRTNDVLEAALSWGVSYIIQWNLYDPETGDLFGLYDKAGNVNPLGSFYAERLRGTD